MNDRLTSPTVIKEVCEKYGFQFKKSLGQNFLIDSNVIEDTIEATNITKETSVIEIGPGFGSLTQMLIPAAKDVTSIEVDKSLIPVLTDLFSHNENFHLVNEDVLKFDLNSIIKNEDTVVVANLPYYITSPIITYLLEEQFKIKTITVMVQKEVAQRMVAKPGKKDYGAITCLINYYADAEIVRDVSPNCFMPKPKVTSSVVMLKILDKPRVEPKNKEIYFKLVRAIFMQRRKTLLNALCNSRYFTISKSELEEALAKLGYDKNVRGETLSIFDYAKIADIIY